jgi:hypothetical protein
MNYHFHNQTPPTLAPSIAMSNPLAKRNYAPFGPTAGLSILPIRFNYLFRVIIVIVLLSTDCVFVFCVDLRTNRDYFPIQN